MDIRLHYEKQGSGPPLVLLHGNGEDGSYFARQMEDFSRDFTVYALDTRGHGQSPRGTAPFTISQFADDLLAFLDSEGLERPDLLGFSDGGNIALTFALRHGDRVERLVLNGANLSPKGVKPSVQIPIVLGYHMASLFPGEKARHNADLLRLMVKEPHIGPADLRRLTMPVLVIVGDRDMIRPGHSRLIAEHIPGAKFVELPGDHFIANKAPTAFNQAVRDFFSETEQMSKE